MVSGIAFVRLSELPRSTSFRLGLLHASLFAVSVTVLFIVVYWATDAALTDQFDRDIEAELDALESQASSQDVESLGTIIARRGADRADAYYLLRDQAGNRLAGNLPTMSRQPGWIDTPLVLDVETKQPKDRSHVIRAKGVSLAGGGMLFVGRDIYALNELREVIVRGFVTCLLVTIALALGSGVLLSAGVLRRVENIDRATREIMGGELSRRLPRSGRHDEFDNLAARVNTMLDRIQALMEDVQQVSNDIAHDLRTPLTRLRQRLELAKVKAHSTQDYDLAIGRAIQHVDTILHTFTSLLRIAQIEAGARRAGFASVDLSSLVGNLLEVYAPVAIDGRRTLEGQVAPDVVVRGDGELLTQMIANLIENALQHTPEGTRVQLELMDSDRGPVLTLADDGPGIPAASHARVFQRFARLDASRATPGSGLGLSLVAAIADLHGTAVALSDNRPGLRVTLRFEIPEITDSG